MSSSPSATILVLSALATVTVAGVIGYVVGQKQNAAQRRASLQGSSLVDAMESLQAKVNKLSEYVEQHGSVTASAKVVNPMRASVLQWSKPEVQKQLKSRLANTLSAEEIVLVGSRFKDVNGEELVDLVEDEAHSLTLRDKLSFMGLDGTVAVAVHDLLIELVAS